MNGRILILLVLFFASCKEAKKKSLPFYDKPDFTPLWLSSGDKQYSSLHTIAAFSFVDQHGESVSNKNVQDKIYVANFFFTTCAGICPKMMKNLKKVQKVFETNNDVIILSHSVLPETDSVHRLATYAKRFSIQSNWHLLTGNKQAIYNLARKSYFADEETGYSKSSNEFLHTENCILVDQKRRIRGVYNGTLELEIDKLVEHIAILRKE